MSISATRAHLLDRLRAEVSGTGTGARDSRVLAFGVDALDQRLADGGMSGSALHEVAASQPGLAEDAAATLFAAGIAGRFAEAHGSVVWAISQFDLYSPGLEQSGLAPARTLFVEAREDAQVLAVMEDALRHGSVSAVVGEVRRASMTATRRLQLAATEGKTPALLFRRWRRNGVCPLSEPSAACTRWRVGCAPSPSLAIPGVGQPHWQVELARQRNGDGFTFILEACDATGRLALPAATADRAVAAAGADTRAA